jgi:hypothetical protein
MNKYGTTFNINISVFANLFERLALEGYNVALELIAGESTTRIVANSASHHDGVETNHED